MNRRAASLGEGILFLALAGFFLFLLFGGGIRAIVHPRMNAWIGAAAAIAASIGVARIIKPASEARGGPSLIRALPLVAVMAAAGVYASAGSKSGGYAPVQDMSPEEKAFRSAIEERERAWKDATEKDLPKTLDFGNDALYWPLYNRVYDDLEKAKGKRIRVEGFAFRDSGYPPGTFLVARNLMWCCSADMSLIGFLVRYDEADSVENGQWVEVEGVLEIGDARAAGASDGVSPIIAEAQVRPINREKSKVIYPY
jgi:putative membrane protein